MDGSNDYTRLLTKESTTKCFIREGAKLSIMGLGLNSNYNSNSEMDFNNFHIIENGVETILNIQ